MEPRSVAAEHRDRVAAYVAVMPEIAGMQIFAQHGLVMACLCALARVRVADFVDGKRTLGEIANAGQLDLPILTRILRFLEPHGIFEVADGRYSLTKKGRLLRSDSPIFSSMFVRGANDAAWDLDHSLKTGKPAFCKRSVSDFWSSLAAQPDQQEAFADMMRLQSSMLGVACVPLMDMSGIKTIADIGGGTGDLLGAILEANPDARGILIDQPEMLARAHPALVSGALATRCTLRPGDLLGELPRADAYVLSNVLHNWDDADAAKILRSVRKAAPTNARAVILSLVLPETPGDHPAKIGDIGMMTLFGAGRERTEAELRELLDQTGWRVKSVTPTRVAAIIIANADENVM